MIRRASFAALTLAAALAAGAVIADSGPGGAPASQGSTRPTTSQAANTGEIKVAHADWMMIVKGDKTGQHILGGGEKPTTLPADKYAVTAYAEKVKSADGKTTLRLTIPKPKATFEVKAGQTAEVAIGTPIIFVLTATPGADAVVFGVTMFDVTKANVIPKFTSSSGKPLPAPKLAICDANGKEIDKFDMSYG
jgi:hypothetical protein